MKIRDKNPELKKVIETFNKRSHKAAVGKEPATEMGFWRAVAEAMNKPRRARYEVGLDRLEKFAKAKEMIVVPGTVLGKGEITKPLNVAAMRFSASAKTKIEKAGGKCVDIADIDEKTASKMRIMG